MSATHVNGSGNQNRKLPLFYRLIQNSSASVLVLLVILIVIGRFMNSSFLDWGNLTSIFRSTSFVAIIALGMTFVFIALELDLSVGSVVALSGIVVGMLLKEGVPIPVACAAGVLSGLASGIVTGFVIVHFNIPSMIGSLGMQFILRGVVYVVTKGIPLYPLPEGFEKLGLGSVLGVPTPWMVYMALALIFWYLLKHTTYGRAIYAIGGNKDTAWLCGLNVKTLRMSTYWITGALSGLVGVLLASRLSSAQPNAGQTWEMLVIASIIVGGVSMFGGVGNIIGTVIGSLLIGMLTNFLVMIRLSVYWQNIAIGVIILGAVIMDQYRKTLALRMR
ncbi:MAG: ABC transporter permease [Planctomycetota bacterium]|jgi:ribose/xylose/arabinose/galactoside ABC-type transport system permease subunit|nr:ABC transporter permease [Planctomycetota bacterium]